jgi:hypothetical protein
MIPVATMKQWLGIAADNTTYDAQLTALEGRLLAVIERKLDWYFGAARPVVETFDGDGRDTIWLRQPPVDGETFGVYTRTGVGYAWSELADTDYELDRRKLAHATSWPYGRRNIQVRYSEGFASAPGDIYQLLLNLIESHVSVGAAAGGAVSGETLGDYSYTIKDVTETDVVNSPLWESVWQSWKRGRI